MIKKLQKYAIYGIIAIVMLVVMILLFTCTNVKRELIYTTIVIGTIILLGGLKMLKWLFKQENPTVPLTCVGVTFLMLTPIFFIIWLFTISDIFLQLAIISLLVTCIIIVGSLIITFIMYIKEKNKLKKNGQ